MNVYVFLGGSMVLKVKTVFVTPKPAKPEGEERPPAFLNYPDENISEPKLQGGIY